VRVRKSGCLSFAALFCFAVPLKSTDRPDPSGDRILVVYFKGAAAYPSHIVSQIQSEVEHVMRPLKLRFEWRAMEGNYRTDPACMAVILTFSGTCSYDQSCRRNLEPVSLGWTHITDGEILPFCSVDCTLVRQTIASVLQKRLAQDRQTLISRAIGRVIAHEFYHILAGTRQHSKDGLASASVEPNDLVLYEGSFDTVAIARMRIALEKRSCAPAQDIADGQ
jgi:hypothetical protein